jgi:N-acetylmuramoyl-L-alanine amidase
MPILALAMASASASAGELRGLRLVQSDAGTRAELRLDADADVRLFQLHDPDRLVLDLPATRLAGGFRLPGANGAVSNLRTGQPTPGTLRVVFDLAVPVRSAYRFESDADGRVLVVDLVSPDGRPAPADASPRVETARIESARIATARTATAGTATAGNANAGNANASNATARIATSRQTAATDAGARSELRAWTQADVSSVAEPLRDADEGAGVASLPEAAPVQATQATTGATHRMSETATDPPVLDAIARAAQASPSYASAPYAGAPSANASYRNSSYKNSSYKDSSYTNASYAGSATPGNDGVPARDAAQPASTTRARAPSRTMLDVIGHGQRKLIVAIDAGHGGKDPGAHGPGGVREKAVTLAVARELARQVDADPGMRAVLIRDGDEFVSLTSRYMKARAAQADLFISIHADASPNDSATGASVFVLSTRGASSQAARWLADSENAADLVGGVSLDSRDHKLAAVLLDLSQSATMRASDDVAQQVLGALKNVGKAHKQGIERANFVVLRSPDVPSMLVETGFITNPGEEQRLNDPGYRSRLAAAIADGVRRYFIGQPPPGSWYAARGAGGSPSGGGPTQVASAPD